MGDKNSCIMYTALMYDDVLQRDVCNPIDLIVVMCRVY